MTSPSAHAQAEEGPARSDEAAVVEPSVRRWETGSRAYTAEVALDLFGDLVLTCTNAGIGKRHYRERTLACGEQAIAAALRKLGRLRRSHAYTLVELRRTNPTA